MGALATIGLVIFGIIIIIGIIRVMFTPLTGFIDYFMELIL